MKNDFCVEEMMETQFPHLNPFIREDYPTTTEAIDDWFKRCLADMGVGIKEGFPCDWALMSWEDWFNKWFSQFIEKGEEK